jgi:phytoene dehydrogenase-like protein
MAQAGVGVHVIEAADTIGGGTRSAELTLPGLTHDLCSAFHPFGLASRFFASLPLAEHGVEWSWSEITLAHPLDGGRIGLMYQSIDETAAAMGHDGDRWRSTFGPLADRFIALSSDVLRPLIRFPNHPIILARFGLRAGLSASSLARRFRSDEARALWAGSAAHVFRPLGRPFTAAAGTMLTAAGHAVGWPVAVGGSQRIADAMASLLTELGGTIETGRRVESLDELGDPRVVLLDTSPSAAIGLIGDRLPSASRKAFRAFKHGPAAFKVDLAVEGGVPWTRPEAGRAGTVHLGGTIEEICAAEHDVSRGVMPRRPFVLVGQQAVCDPSRAVGDVQPIWAYAHVPAGHDVDVTDVVIGQIERFAPGTRDRIVAQHTMMPADLEASNPNHVGGDIAGGANSLGQLVFRPRRGLNPYATGAEGVYLCSASTPPGGGVHGMCGHFGARAALDHLGI